MTTPKVTTQEVHVGSVLRAYGHSEMRLIRYVSEFDNSYCYEDLEEGYNNLHTLRVAQVYDDDFDEWISAEVIAS